MKKITPIVLGLALVSATSANAVKIHAGLNAGASFAKTASSMRTAIGAFKTAQAALVDPATAQITEKYSKTAATASAVVGVRFDAIGVDVGFAYLNKSKVTLTNSKANGTMSYEVVSYMPSIDLSYNFSPVSRLEVKASVGAGYIFGDVKAKNNNVTTKEATYTADNAAAYVNSANTALGITSGSSASASSFAPKVGLGVGYMFHSNVSLRADVGYVMKVGSKNKRGLIDNVATVTVGAAYHF